MLSNICIPYSKSHLYFSFVIFAIFFYFPINDAYKNGIQEFDIVTGALFTIGFLFFFFRRH